MTYVAAQEEQAMAEASAWLARLQRDEVSEADSLEFDAWLGESPRNAAAYRRRWRSGTSSKPPPPT